MTQARTLSQRILYSMNPWSLVTFTRKIGGLVGYKFLLMLSSNYYITKGFAHMFIRILHTPWYRGMGISAQETTIADTIAMMPWSMKGFFGIISDNFALYGYSKTSYLQIFSILGTISAILLAVIPDSALFAVYQIPALLMFLIHCQGSTGDLYCEGKYVEKMKQFPQVKGDLVIYVWFCQLLGGLIPTFVIGPFTDNYNPKWLLMIEIPLVAQMIPFLIAGCMVDDKVSPDKRNKWNSTKFKSQWKIMSLGILMGVSAMTLSLMGFAPIMAQAIAAGVISLIMAVLVWFWMNKIIAGAIIYLFCTTAFNLRDGSTTLYWSLEQDQDCVSNGPQFTYTFILTWGNLVSSLFNLLGLWAFQFFLINLELRAMFWITNSIQIVVGLFGIMLYSRTNLALGISDHVFYFLTTPIFGQFFYMMNFMPSNILIAKMCPKDVEVTVYAILAGFSNFGNSVATYVGTYLSIALGLKTTPPCDYSNLVLLVVIISLIPIVEIPLTFLLIPKGKITSDFLKEGSKELEPKVEKI